MGGRKTKLDRAPLARDYDTSSLANAPQQRRSQELSLRILEGAERVLRRDGADGFTINAVAAEAGVSIGGIYGRFKNREELLSAIHGEVLMKVQRHLEAVAERPFDTLREAAETFAREVVNVFEDAGGLFPVVHRSGAAATAHSVERAIRAAFAKVVSPFRTQIKHLDPELAPKLVVHLLLASVVRESTTDPRVTDRTVGWDNLRRELPRVAAAVLTGAY